MFAGSCVCVSLWCFVWLIYLARLFLVTLKEPKYCFKVEMIVERVFLFSTWLGHFLESGFV